MANAHATSTSWFITTAERAYATRIFDADTVFAHDDVTHVIDEATYRTDSLSRDVIQYSSVYLEYEDTWWSVFLKTHPADAALLALGDAPAPPKNPSNTNGTTKTNESFFPPAIHLPTTGKDAAWYNYRLWRCTDSKDGQMQAERAGVTKPWMTDVLKQGLPELQPYIAAVAKQKEKEAQYNEARIVKHAATALLNAASTVEFELNPSVRSMMIYIHNLLNTETAPPIESSRIRRRKNTRSFIIPLLDDNGAPLTSLYFSKDDKHRFPDSDNIITASSNAAQSKSCTYQFIFNLRLQRGAARQRVLPYTWHQAFERAATALASPDPSAYITYCCKIIGICCICGHSLTASRDKGIGPVCYAAIANSAFKRNNEIAHHQDVPTTS